MSSKLTYAYAEITKATRTPDGDVMVEGIVASPSLDLDQQRMDPAFLKRAMPEWFKWGNIREQHGPVAAGVSTEMTEGDGDSWHIKALIVDPGAKEKVLKKVYKGFSVGIKHARVVKAASAPKGLIVDGNIVEVSLTDRPSNSDSKLSICKSAGGILRPVNDLGELIMDEEEFTGKWLTADVHKAALATAGDILKGDFDTDDAQATEQTIGDMCDLIVHEAMLVKSALASGEDEIDITGLNRASEALTFFVDGDVSDYPGGAPGMQGDMDEYVRKYVDAGQGANASLVTADLEKAVTGAVKPLLDKLELVEAELAEVKKTARPGGPLTMAVNRPSERNVDKFTVADHYHAVSKNPNLDPALAAGFAALAQQVGEGS